MVVDEAVVGVLSKVLAHAPVRSPGLADQVRT